VESLKTVIEDSQTTLEGLSRWRRGIASALLVIGALAGMTLGAPAQAQIVFRGASSAGGPGTGTITFRAATSAVSGNIVFRAASSSGTPTAATPTFRAAASATAATGVLTLAIARPANTVENDVMIASIGVSANSPTITPPPGWTLVRQTNNTATNANSLVVYRKVATSTEPVNYTWTFSASTGSAGGIQTFFNVDTANPIDVENGQTTPSGTAHATPSVITTVANTMLVTSHTFSSSRTWTAPGGMTESFDVASIAPNNAAGQSIEGNRQVQAAAGATGVKSATVGGNADVGVTHILALRPALRIPLPAGTTQNDVMIAAIAVQPNTAAITPPTGWTLVNRIDNAIATASSLAVYRKTAGAAEPSSYVWGIAGASFSVGGIQSFSGVDTTTPVDVQNGQATASALTHATPSVATTAANAMVVTHHTFASSATWTPPAGMTESYDVSALAVPNAGGQSMEGARVAQAAAGATGVKTATASANADSGATHILALRPSGASINIARPATAVENDVMIAAIGVTPSSVTITPPSGWALIRRTNNAGGVTNSLAVYMKVANSAEPASYYWTFSAAVTAVGGIQAHAGVDVSNPIDIENGQTTPSAATHASPNVSTTIANTMVVTHHTYSSSQNWTAPAGMTESFDQRSGGASATGQSIEGARVAQAAAGATGVKTATAAGGGGSADFGNTHILALRPQATNDIDLPTPAGTAAGDVMIAAIGFQTTALTITPPAGWTSIRRTVNAAGTANALETFRRTAIAGEPAVHRFAFSAVATAAVGGIQSFGGVDTTTPVNVENGQTTASALTHATPGVATTVVNTMIVTAHTFASSATWAPPGGMVESADRANLTVPNAAGQSIELNRVEQGPIGATGVKTATASANADTGNTHILALRPASIIVTPANFNAFETSTAAGAITGQIYTKLAGTAFSLDIVAILGGVQHAAFTDTLQVDLVTGSSGGLNCPGAPATIAGTAQSVNLASGRGTTGGFTVANAYRDVRVRIRYPVASPTVTSCSTDNFTIRPVAFSAPTSNMTNAGTLGAPVARAGDTFTITAVAVAGYDGTPSIDNTRITAHAGAIQNGAVGGTFGAASSATGTATGAAFNYSEVGNFAIGVNGVLDNTFTNASTDQGNGDCTLDFSNALVGGRYGCYFGNNAVSSTIGRFTPDNFDIALNAPAFSTGCAPGSFTYLGQPFTYTVQPVITVTARNSAALGNQTTQNYQGLSWWKMTSGSLTGKTYTAAVGILDPSGVPGTDPVIRFNGDGLPGEPAAGQGTLTFSSGTGLFFTRAAPVASFDADISLAINVIDTDGVVLATNPARFGQATAGNGIAFNNGKSMRFGRLAISNANGSQLVPLLVRLETQYWSGPPSNAFITNAADSCTTLAGTNITMGNFQGNLGPLASCKTNINANVTFAAGRGNLQLTAPGSGNGGSVDLTVQLGSGAFGSNSCVSPGSPPPQATTGANRAYLQGNWTGGLFTQDPTGRASFGQFRGAEEVIFIRENF